MSDAPPLPATFELYIEMVSIHTSPCPRPRKVMTRCRVQPNEPLATEGEVLAAFPGLSDRFTSQFVSIEIQEGGKRVILRDRAAEPLTEDYAPSNWVGRLTPGTACDMEVELAFLPDDILARYNQSFRFRSNGKQYEYLGCSLPDRFAQTLYEIASWYAEVVGAYEYATRSEFELSDEEWVRVHEKLRLWYDAADVRYAEGKLTVEDAPERTAALLAYERRGGEILKAIDERQTPPPK